MCFIYPHTNISQIVLCVFWFIQMHTYLYMKSKKLNKKSKQMMWVFFLQSPSLKCKIGLWSVESAFVDQMTRVYSVMWVVSFLFYFFYFETVIPQFPESKQASYH